MADRRPLTLAEVPDPSRHICVFFNDSVEERRPLRGVPVVHPGAGPVAADQARALAQRIGPLLEGERIRTPVAVTGLLGTGAMSLAIFPLGDQAARGVAAVGSGRAGFPDDL